MSPVVLAAPTTQGGVLVELLAAKPAAWAGGLAVVSPAPSPVPTAQSWSMGLVVSSDLDQLGKLAQELPTVPPGGVVLTGLAVLMR